MLTRGEIKFLGLTLGDLVEEELRANLNPDVIMGHKIKARLFGRFTLMTVTIFERGETDGEKE